MRKNSLRELLKQGMSDTTDTTHFNADNCS
jgi:hypothetical protein